MKFCQYARLTIKSDFFRDYSTTTPLGALLYVICPTLPSQETSKTDFDPTLRDNAKARH